MKLIEAMKQVKDLIRKAEDLRRKIATTSAHLDIETPPYPDPAGQIDKWLQAHKDIIREIECLRIAIQRTNLNTEVTISLDDQAVTRSIAAWIHRRRDLALLDLSAWKQLTDRNLPATQQFKQSSGETREVRIVRNYNPVLRDDRIEQFTSEPTIIDSRLEMVNAVTDLIE